MQELKDEKLSEFLKQGLTDTPSAPYGEFQKIQGMIKQSEDKFLRYELFSFFNFQSVAVLFAAVVLITIFFQLPQEAKLVSMTHDQYRELLTLNSASENLKVGVDWL